VSDATATDVFSVSSTDESGDVDGGMYMCRIKALAQHSKANNASGIAGRYWEGYFMVVNDPYGTDAYRTTELTTPLEEGGPIGTDLGYKTISSVAFTIVDTSSLVKTVQVEVDLAGSSVSDCMVTCWVELLWHTYRSAPVIAQL
jgi:hypothetical protein